MNSINSIVESLKNNPLLISAIGLIGGAGLITFWVKDVPKMILNFLKRELTTELIITSQHEIFHETLKWIEKTHSNTNFRKLKLTNGRWGYSKKTTTSIGYGSHWIGYKKYLFFITLFKESANQTEYDKETLSILKIGRSRKIFDEFIQEIKTKDLDLSKTKIYKMEENWCFAKDNQKRKLNSIFIEKHKKDILIKSLTDFINNEDWYVDHGIPYQFGILLYGAPGTGKTSLIKAIAGYLNYPIYYLSPQKLSKIELAMSSIPDKCIIVIEDIDSNSLTHSRKIDKLKNEEDSIIEYSKINLSEVLNSLDGMFSAHGRVLIATTNHIEKLDAALIRPGRIDLKIEIGYVNNEIFKSFIDKFFPCNKLDMNKLNIKDNITVAELQNMVLQQKTLNEIVNKISIQNALVENDVKL